MAIDISIIRIKIARTKYRELNFNILWSNVNQIYLLSASFSIRGSQEFLKLALDQFEIDINVE